MEMDRWSLTGWWSWVDADGEYFTFLDTQFLRSSSLEITEHQQQPNPIHPHLYFFPHSPILSPPFAQIPSLMVKFFLVFMHFLKDKEEVGEKANSRAFIAGRWVGLNSCWCSLISRLLLYSVNSLPVPPTQLDEISYILTVNDCSDQFTKLTQNQKMRQWNNR